MSRDRLQTLALLLVIFLLGMALRLYQLDADSLWFDEIITAGITQRDLQSAVTYAEHHSHPPLSDVVSWLFVRVFGNSDFVLRLHALLFGSLSVLLAYKAGELLWTKEVGLAGAFLLAVNAYHVRYSQEARMYALMAFLALLSLIFLVVALRRNQKVLWLGFALSTGLGIYNHYFAFLFLPAEILFAVWVIGEEWLSLRKQEGRVAPPAAGRGRSAPARRALMLCLALALVGLFYTPWVGPLQGHIANLTAPELWGKAATGSIEVALSILSTVLSSFGGVPLPLWAVVFALGLTASDPKRAALVACWIGVPFAFLAIVRSSHFVDPRMLLFILPLYLLVVAHGAVTAAFLLHRLARRVRRLPSWLLVVSCTLSVLLLGALSILPLRDYYLWQKKDWRGAAQYLVENMSPGDVVLVDSQSYFMTDAHWVDSCLSYYLRSLGIEDPPVIQVGTQLGADLQKVGEDQGEVWAVLFYEHGPRSWRKMDEIVVTYFHQAPLFRLSEPSGDEALDTASMLKTLLKLLPDEARFDVHLALADIHVRTEAFDEARRELEMATGVKPRNPQASRDLADRFAELDRLSHPEDAPLQHPRWHSLGDVIALLGYDVSSTNVQGGDVLHVSLYWQALASIDRDYSAFVHVVGQEDRMRAQDDRLLGQVSRGGYLTSSWQVEETVREEYELVLAPDTPAGEYVLKTGVYYWETGERLPALDGDGRRAADDSILLGTVTVVD